MMPDWSVLLLAGASGTGKTTVAKAISRERGIAWVQVDDLRLALQYSHVRLADDAATEALHYFVREPSPWSRPADELRDALIATGGAMADAIAVVTGNHLVQGDPAVIEGDGILPSLLDRPDLREFVASGALRMLVLAPESERDLLENLIARGRGEHLDPDAPETRRIAETIWRYSQWLIDEAEARGIAVVPTEPRDTLAARIIGWRRDRQSRTP